MTIKNYIVRAFSDCMLMVKNMQHGICNTTAYYCLSYEDKKLIDCLIRSNQLS
jgi:hypothetical protein